MSPPSIADVCRWALSTDDPMGALNRAHEWTDGTYWHMRRQAPVDATPEESMNHTVDVSMWRDHRFGIVGAIVMAAHHRARYPS